MCESWGPGSDWGCSELVQLQVNYSFQIPELTLELFAKLSY